MPRPSFDQIASYDEFAKYYWYRDELIKICKSLNINASGTIIELMETIRLYFSGVRVKPQKQLPEPKPTNVAVEPFCKGFLRRHCHRKFPRQNQNSLNSLDASAQFHPRKSLHHGIIDRVWRVDKIKNAEPIINNRIRTFYNYAL